MTKWIENILSKLIEMAETLERLYISFVGFQMFYGICLYVMCQYCISWYCCSLDILVPLRYELLSDEY